MEQRIKIKHPGARGWAGIAVSAFDPAKHERYEAKARVVEAKAAPESSDAVAVTGISNRPDAEAQFARLNLTATQINAMDRDEVRQQLDGMGVDFDARWGAQKLRRALTDSISEARG